jgi:hypothetical protein
MDTQLQTLTPQILSAIVGVIISLLFTLIPGLQKWYDGLGQYKGLFMVGLMVVVGLVIFGLSCIPSFPLPMLTCDIAGIWELLVLIASAIVGNQMAYLTTKKLGEPASSG